MGGSIGWHTIGHEITKSSTEDLRGRAAARSRVPLLGGFDPAAAPRPPDLALADQTPLAASHGTALGHGKRVVAEPTRLRTATEIIIRICEYCGCAPIEPLTQQVACTCPRWVDGQKWLRSD